MVGPVNAGPEGGIAGSEGGNIGVNWELKRQGVLFLQKKSEQLMV